MEQIARVRQLLHEQKLDGLFVGKRNNFAWITGGKENYINNGVDQGEAYLFITASDKYVAASNIEMPRIFNEEVGALGYQPVQFPWYESILNGPMADLIEGKKIGTDCAVLAGDNIVDVAAALSQQRSVLDADQITQYRALAVQASQVVEKVCRTLEPGWTEQRIRAEVAREAHLRSLNPTVILIATDERIYNYRHPIATEKKLDTYAMIVICAEKYGLVASSTRFAHFGSLSKELADKAQKVAYIDAGMIANTKAGVSYKDYFKAVEDLYAEAGYPEEWKLHHQGGPAGYAAREFTATPSTEGGIRLNEAFAWNPSITGCKSEDTIVLTSEGPVVISETGDWPAVNVNYDGKAWKRPAILIR